MADISHRLAEGGTAVPVVVRTLRAVSAIAATGFLLLLPSTAYADGIGPGGASRTDDQTSGSANGQNISATAIGITYDQSKNGSGSSTGPLTPATNWSPPACWYAPIFTPQQLKQIWQTYWNQDPVGSQQWRDYFQNGHPYTDFNIQKSSQGHWWTAVGNPDRINDPAVLSCNKPDFWVNNGQPPLVRNAVTPEVLAELAYAKIRVPSTTINLNPSGIQTVNLNTWAWLDKATFKPVSVTASVPVLHISTTTTATPVALHIDPGTQDANVYPASGDCPIHADGSIGTPYNPADGNNIPPCGLTYLHATTNSTPYQLRATIRWRISWTGTGNTGGTLPDGTFGTTTPLTVQEIQTVVR